LRRPRAICGNGWFGNLEDFHERKRIMMPRFNSFLCRQPYFWRKPERGHESAPSAKENRQARKYWFELEREVIALKSRRALPKAQKMADKK
jgi:hypothetical protein